LAKVISLTHGKDLDGIASAAIVLRYANKIGCDFKVFFSEPQLLHVTLENLPIETNVSEIIVSDLGLNKNLLDKINRILKDIKGNYQVKIRWFDHHLWNHEVKVKIEKLIDELIVNERFCSAELVQRILLPDDAIAAKVALLARDADFSIFSNEISKKLSKIISYRGMPLEALVEMLSKGTFWNSELEKKFREIISEEKKMLRKCLRTLESYNIKEFKVALVKGSISAGEIADILAEKGYDIIVIISPEGKVSLRRGNESINLVPIAEKLNGGGHPFAAGGSLNYGWFDKFLAKNFGIYRKKEIILKAIDEVLP